MHADIRSKIGSYFQLGVFSVLVIAGLESPGCGGQEIDGPHLHDAGTSGFGSGSTGTSGSGTTKPGTTGPGMTGIGSGGGCGDGVVEPGEECDGTNFNGRTCSSATMGTAPSGALSCSSNCLIDVSGCYATGTTTPNTGGYPGTGPGGYAGSPYGTGGMFLGTGGGASAACYANGGVPDPKKPITCLTGQTATNACLYDYQNSAYGGSTSDPTCGAGCGCARCASSYANCINTPNCLNLINSYSNDGSQVANNALSCMENSGCKLTCPYLGGPLN